MVYYDDDDDYTSLKSMTNKEIERYRRHSIPSVKEMIEIMNTDRHGVFMNLRTWKNKTKNEYNKKMLSDLESLVSKYKLHLTKYQYKFFSKIFQDEDNIKYEYITYGKDGMSIEELTI